MNDFNRRKFLKLTAVMGAAGSIVPMVSSAAEKSSSELKISLAQWSLHRAYEAGELNPKNFAADTKNMFDLKAVEYVNGFYTALPLAFLLARWLLVRAALPTP